jgi:hypothetical protein
MSNQRHSQASRHNSASVPAEPARSEPRPFIAKAQSVAPGIQPHVAPAANAGHDFSQVQSPATPLRIQAKLTVSQPGDQYEQEAERVAASVVRQLNANPGGEQAQANTQAVPPARSLVQRSAISGMPIAPDMEQAVQSARGGGQALSSPLGQQMGAAFGADFGGLHIHTDQRADTLNRALSARAFTTGQDVFFRQGEYQPGSRAGQELLAHELTHVVQQGGQPSVQRALGDVVEAPEAEAEEAADLAPAAQLEPAIITQIEAAVVDGWNQVDASLPEEAAVDGVVSQGPIAENAVAAPVQGRPELAQLEAGNILQEATAEPAPPQRGLLSRIFGRAPKPPKPVGRVEHEQIRSRATGNKATRVAAVSSTVVRVGTAGVNALKAVVPAMNVLVVAKVIPFINIFFSAIAAALDFRAASKSADIAHQLKQVSARAKADGGDPAVIDAIEYAIKQKETKKVRRYITAFAGLASLGGGIALTAGGALGAVALGALLASNPVGWGIALGLVGIGALVGIGMLCYKLFRRATKKNPGKQREEMAARLYDAWVPRGDALARTAIQKLNLNPEEMRLASLGAKKDKARVRSIDEIKRKLGST